MGARVGMAARFPIFPRPPRRLLIAFPRSTALLLEGLIPGMDRDGKRLMSMPTTPGIDMGINRPRLFEVAGIRVLVVVAIDVITWVTVVGLVVTWVTVVGLVVTWVDNLVVVLVESFVVALVETFVTVTVLAGRVLVLLMVLLTVLTAVTFLVTELVFVTVLVLAVTAQSPSKIARQRARKMNLKCNIL
jgi:hypothetical protein